jgi:hypothetical protein
MGGDLVGPSEIAVSSSGFVYLLDGVDMIEKFTESGKLVSRWKVPLFLFYLTTAPGDLVYVVDRPDGKVLKFHAPGSKVVLERTWLARPAGAQYQPERPAGLGSFTGPNGPEVWTVEPGGPGVITFTPDGSATGELQEFEPNYGGNPGSVKPAGQDGIFGLLSGAGVNDILIADSHTVGVFHRFVPTDGSPDFLTLELTLKPKLGTIRSLRGVADGFWVSDGTVIQKYSLSGALIQQIDSSDVPGGFLGISSISTDAGGLLYATDLGHYRVVVFGPGNHLPSTGGGKGTPLDLNCPSSSTASAQPSSSNGQLTAGKTYTETADATGTISSGPEFSQDNSLYKPSQAQIHIDGRFTFVSVGSTKGTKNVTGTAKVKLTFKRVQGTAANTVIVPLAYQLTKAAATPGTNRAETITYNATSSTPGVCKTARFSAHTGPVPSMTFTICGATGSANTASIRLH